MVNSNDTVADMHLMYKHHEIKGDKWIFVKGMENAFFDIELGKGNPWEKKDTFHRNEREAYMMTLLLDKDRHIRGKYLTIKSSEITRITKEIVLLLLFFRLLRLNKQLFYLFYIFCSFTLLVCGEKNILPNLTNSQKPEPVRSGCFWLLGARAGAGAN